MFHIWKVTSYSTKRGPRVSMADLVLVDDLRCLTLMRSYFTVCSETGNDWDKSIINQPQNILNYPNIWDEVSV